MKIFLAGGINGNLKAFWKLASAKLQDGWQYREAFDKSMYAYLAGKEAQRWMLEDNADLSCGIREYGKHSTIPRSSNNIMGGGGLLHSVNGGKTYDPIIIETRPYILESFFYADTEVERLIPYYGDFLLDSGAFTFMQGKGGSPDFDAYAERYIEFINRNHIEKYFELDIDSVVGYDRVKLLRAKLERLTGRQSIPVWHKSRGKDEFIGLCKDYPYVAIGGLVDGAKKGEYARALWKYFPWFIRTAHENGAKIHALGFTSIEGIQLYHFDSVDSTAWTTGNRFGHLYFFDGKTMKKRDAPPGHRIKDSRAAALHNYTEWIKFQRYADTHL